MVTGDPLAVVASPRAGVTLPIVASTMPAAANPPVPPPASTVPDDTAEALAAALHVWCLQTGRAASINPRQFLAELPRWQHEAVAGHRGLAAELRPLAVQLGEGVALMRSSRQPEAEARLGHLIAALERHLAANDLAAPISRELHWWLGATRLNLGNTHYYRGDYARALPDFRSAMETMATLGDRGGEATALGNLGNIASDVGLHAEALGYLLRARAIDVELQRPEHIARHDNNLSDTHLELGNLAAAREAAASAEATWQRAGRTAFAAMARIRVAVVDIRAGRAVAALARLRRMAAVTAQESDQTVEAHRLVAMAEALAALERPAEAAATYDEALAWIDTRAGPDYQLGATSAVALARLRLLLGELAAAEAAARRAEREVAGIGLPTIVASDAAAVLAAIAERAGDLASALAHERHRHEVWTEFHRRDNERRAQVLAAQHQLDLARAENARLAEALAAIATRLERERQARPAPAAKVVAGSAAEPASLRPLGLTPREAEVLWWVAEGKTNDVIATILGTGLATVKKHLLSIFQKLGVENRTSAAGIALRHLRGAGAAGGAGRT
jgi:DNA-binding CsgD family transcriptional regulator